MNACTASTLKSFNRLQPLIWHKLFSKLSRERTHTNAKKVMGRTRGRHTETVTAVSNLFVRACFRRQNVHVSDVHVCSIFAITTNALSRTDKVSRLEPHSHKTQWKVPFVTEKNIFVVCYLRWPTADFAAYCITCK